MAMNRIALICVWILNLSPLKAQDTTDYLTVISNPFIERILHTPEPVYTLYPAHKPLAIQSIPFSEVHQELVKTPANCYLLVPNTGRVYRMVSRTDSLIRFNRIDRTVAMFYNIGAYVFHIGEDLYSYGGYGFWKTNGCLRKFNFSDGEWDIVPLSEEVIGTFFPNSVQWVDIKSGLLYVPLQNIVNEGLQESEYFNGRMVRESMVLDLKTGQWKKLGRTSEKFVNFYTRGADFKKFFQNETGCLFFYQNQFYWVDFPRNRITQVGDQNFRQSVERLGGVICDRRMQGNTLYVYDHRQRKFDSLVIKPEYYKGESFPIWEESFPDYLLFLIPLLLLAAGTFGYYRRKAKQDPSGQDGLSAAGDKLIFSETETRLLRLLLEKSRAGKCASIEELNYVLGLRDKNLGIQKKIRSEIINAINQKYKVVFRKEDLLIHSIRSQQDKRYFEYYLPDPQVHDLHHHLEAASSTI